MKKTPNQSRMFFAALLVAIVVALCLTPFQAAQADLATNLQLYSSMDNTTPHEYVAYWVDAAGNGYDVQGYNAPAYDGGGNRSTAASFDATTAMTLHNGYNPLLDAGTTDFSVSFWYYKNTAPTAHLLNTGNDQGSGVGGYAFYSNGSGLLTLRMNDIDENSDPLVYDTKVQLVYDTGLENTGAWHHVVAVFDRTGTNTVRLYVDNASEPVSAALPDVLRADSNFTPYNVVRSLANSSDERHGEPLYIGSKRSPNNFLNGYMDDIALYRGALSASDVGTLYNASSLSAGTITTPGITPVMIQNFETNLNRESQTLGVLPASYGSYDGAMKEFRQVTDATRGQVLEVNGLANVNEYINYGDVLDPMSDSYTVAMWFKLDDTGRNQTLMSKGANQSSNSIGWAVIYNAGDGQLLVRGNYAGDESGELAVRKELTVGDDQWHHVGLVIDQQTGLFEAYLDGLGSGANGAANGWVPDENGELLPAVNFPPSTEFDSTEPLLLGHHGSSATNGNSNPMVGRLDDFAVWSRALSAAEIMGIYDGTLTFPVVTIPNDIPGDANNDGTVDDADAKRLATYWGATVQDPELSWWKMGDFNGDNTIDARDAAILAA
ncbi:MAG: hypothetical protein GX621_10840, partial [Pirellulaceae bacterium]|nr:hypothetical protein [Pirellulaceae bacterium]